MGRDTRMDDVLHGRPTVADPRRLLGGYFAEGVVVDVQTAGVRFKIPTFDGGKSMFGPAPWNQALVQPGGAPSHTHAPTPPPAGARCLVVFVNGATGPRPWVVQWWSS